MQEQKKQRTTKEKNSFRRKERGVFEKSLTGPTLLEMSGTRLIVRYAPTLATSRNCLTARGAEQRKCVIRLDCLI